jgi:hypothetical protein
VMARVFRSSNGLYFYIGFLLLDALVLGAEGAARLQGGQLPTGVLLGVLAAACVAVAAVLYVRWGRLQVTISPETLTISGQGDRPPQHLEWADVERVRELRGPAYQLSLRGLLPGPYLPHGLLRGETVLEIDAHPGQKVLVRRALVSGYGALQQDVIRSVPKDAEIDLHARWWRD